MRRIPNEELGRMTPEQFASANKMPVIVVLDNIRSLNNVGSFFRTCDAFAVEQILLCGITACPPNKEIHKTALGAESTIPWQYFNDTTSALQYLKQKGFIIVAVEQVEGAVSLEKFNPVPKENFEGFALVFGNEVFGVSDQALALCDNAVEIPQNGTKHSLNVSVSAGVVLWHFFSAFIQHPQSK